MLSRRLVELRNMDAKGAEKKDGLSIEAHGLQDCWNFLHPGYRVEHGSCKWVGTGPLEILKIICIDDERFFRGRWDPAADALDFDLRPDGTKSEDFKSGRGGWLGHHTTKLERPPDTRTFEIKIKSPDGVICDGTASFTLTTQKFIDRRVKIEDVIEGEVVKGGRGAVT
jgi:hypothetical protein